MNQGRKGKRRQATDEAVKLIQSLPREGDSVETKRKFSAELAQMVMRLDISPRHQKAEKAYLDMRNRQEPDREKRERMIQKYDAVYKAKEAGEKAAEELYQEKMAMARAASAGMKEKGSGTAKKAPQAGAEVGHQKRKLTEEEKKERARKYAKTAYERKKARKSAEKAAKELPFRQIVPLPESYDEAARVLRESSQSRAGGSGAAGSHTESYIGRTRP